MGRLEKKNGRREADVVKKAAETNNTAKAPAEDPVVVEKKPNPHSTKKVINKDVKRAWEKQKKHFEQLETALNKLKEEKLRLEAALADPGTYADKGNFLNTEQEYQQVSAQFEKQHTAYEAAFEKMMQIEKELIS